MVMAVDHGAPGTGAAPHGPQPERRQLTVLFCDLVGSTSLSDELDPEAFRDILLRYQRVVRAVVARYEGYLALTVGDGSLAYFGYPAAYDDDAERAIRCAFDLIAEVGRLGGEPALAVRIGVHTGPVVVGDLGANAEILATGVTVNLAARLQTAATPNTALISQDTLRLVPGLFITQDLGTPELKGISRPLRVHRLVQPSGVRTRLEAADSLTPFVGREAELARLDDCWRQACDGRGRAVLVTAEPGMGKSRLLLAMHERLSSQAHTWLEARASLLARTSAYQPVIELLQRGLAIKAGDSNAHRLQRLEQSLDRIGIERAEAVPLLAPLLDLELSAPYRPSPYGPELKRRKTMDLLGNWLLTLSRAQPLVLVLEDLHWADPSTLELIACLVEQLPRHRAMVVLTGRPEFQPDWPALAHVEVLPLPPLRGADTEKMLGSLTGCRALPAEVEEAIVERANGVPLFIEEITRQVLESGQLRETHGRLELAGPVESLAIPATLQDSLMARLDRLGPAKDVAQVAATIGREIAYALLLKVVDCDEPGLRAHLDRLTEAGLLYQRGHPPQATYFFKHALIQDTAYGTLLKARRQKLHGRIALSLEQHFEERVRAEPAMLAEHYEKAGDNAAAVKHYRAAAEAAGARTALREAITHSDKALALLRSLPEGPDRDRIELAVLARMVMWQGPSKGFVHPDTRRVLARGRELLASASDPAETFNIAAWSWAEHVVVPDYERALGFARDLARIGTEMKLPVIVASGDVFTGATLFNLGFLQDALAMDEKAAQFQDGAASRAFASAGASDVIALARVWHGWHLAIAGFPDRYLQLAREGEERARGLGLPLATCVIGAVGLIWAWRLRGQYAELLESARALATICEQYGYEEGRTRSAKCTAIALGMLGQVDEGAAQLREVIAQAQRSGARILASWDWCDLARIYLAGGRLDAAQDALLKAAVHVEHFAERALEAEVHRLMGVLWMTRGEHANAQAAFDRALGVARAQGARLLELRAATGLARLRREQGRQQAALELLTPVYAAFTEGFDTPDLKDAAAVLADIGG